MQVSTYIDLHRYLSNTFILHFEARLGFVDLYQTAHGGSKEQSDLSPQSYDIHYLFIMAHFNILAIKYCFWSKGGNSSTAAVPTPTLTESFNKSNFVLKSELCAAKSNKGVKSVT